MKKFILPLILVMCLCTSCGKKDTQWSITYTVYYSNGVSKTYHHQIIGKESGGYVVASDRGSNYIMAYESRFGNVEKLIDTSAPIEVVSITKKKISD